MVHLLLNRDAGGAAAAHLLLHRQAKPPTMKPPVRSAAALLLLNGVQAKPAIVDLIAKVIDAVRLRKR